MLTDSGDHQKSRRPVKPGDEALLCSPVRREELLFARLQLARQRERLGRAWFDDPRRLGRSVALAEIEFLDPAGALFDLVGRDQDLPDILVDVAEVLLQLQYAVAQPSQV